MATKTKTYMVRRITANTEEDINVRNGEKVQLAPDVEINNCYVHGGVLSAGVRAKVRNCIVNKGALELNTNSMVGTAMMREGTELVVHSGAHMNKLTATGPITFSIFAHGVVKG